MANSIFGVGLAPSRIATEKAIASLRNPPNISFPYFSRKGYSQVPAYLLPIENRGRYTYGTFLLDNVVEALLGFQHTLLSGASTFYFLNGRMPPTGK